MEGGRVCSFARSQNPLIPAEAGNQIHSHTSADLIWIPAFAGMSGFMEINFAPLSFFACER
jgi:hypothetical protein